MPWVQSQTVCAHKDVDSALPHNLDQTALVGIHEARESGLGPLIEPLVQSKPMCPVDKNKINVFSIFGLLL